jgi:hypothetical protein
VDYRGNNTGFAGDDGGDSPNVRRTKPAYLDDNSDFAEEPVDDVDEESEPEEGLVDPRELDGARPRSSSATQPPRGTLAKSCPTPKKIKQSPAPKKILPTTSSKNTAQKSAACKRAGVGHKVASPSKTSHASKLAATNMTAVHKSSIAKQSSTSQKAMSSKAAKVQKMSRNGSLDRTVARHELALPRVNPEKLRAILSKPPNPVQDSSGDEYYDANVAIDMTQSSDTVIPSPTDKSSEEVNQHGSSLSALEVVSDEVNGFTQELSQSQVSVVEADVNCMSQATNSDESGLASHSNTIQADSKAKKTPTVKSHKYVSVMHATNNTTSANAP